MIIDAHVHIGTTINHFKRLHITAGDILREMDANGIDMAILCPAGADLAVDNRAGNDRVAAAVRAHPDRFIGLGSANPWYGETALVELERAVYDLGLRGFKFHSLIQGFHLNDPILVYPLVEKAVDLDLQFHEQLVSLSGNRRLLAYWRGLKSQIWFLMFSLNVSGFPQATEVSHRKIIEQIRRKNLAAGYALLKEHLENGYVNLVTTYRSQRKKKPESGAGVVARAIATQTRHTGGTK